MVDDSIKYIINPSRVELNKAKYVVLDLETTGLNSYYNRIIEFGAVKVEKWYRHRNHGSFNQSRMSNSKEDRANHIYHK